MTGVTTYIMNIEREHTMNAINTETSRQFNHLAPRALNRGRRTFTRKGGLYDDATNTVRFDFVAARKRRGAFLSDKVTVAVTYQAGADYYDVKVTQFDGLSLDSADLVDLCGVSFDLFADLGVWVERA